MDNETSAPRKPVYPISPDVSAWRSDNPTPNGGVYSIMHFLDANGKPVHKDKAINAHFYEYDANGNCIFRTWGSFPQSD